MRRAWPLGVLLACVVCAFAADDEGAWDPSGEFRRPTGGATITPKEPPKSVNEVLKKIQSPKLKAWFARILIISAEAARGDFAASLEKARAARRGVANEPVTQADMPGRAVITALADAVVGELQALLGKTRDGVDTLYDAERSAGTPDLKALLAAGQAYCYLLDLDLDQAVRKERDAIDYSPDTVQPVLVEATCMTSRCHGPDAGSVPYRLDVGVQGRLPLAAPRRWQWAATPRPRSTGSKPRTRWAICRTTSWWAGSWRRRTAI
ncbi:MAG: hypothetical protein HYU66_01230 [Armatimonadetes bacterium]|nr:hypothetical protein [Armatimonadota bacterium]